MRKEEEAKDLMKKVQCISCGNTGYTASPEHVSCECGGRLKEVVKEENSQNDD